MVEPGATLIVCPSTDTSTRLSFGGGGGAGAAAAAAGAAGGAVAVNRTVFGEQHTHTEHTGGTLVSSSQSPQHHLAGQDGGCYLVSRMHVR